MKKTEVLSKTIEYIKEVFSGEASGHDWWHIYRVWNLSKHILRTEKADSFIVEMASLLHDLDDWKLSKNNSEEPEKTIAWLNKFDLDISDKNHIVEIVKNVSFKGANTQNNISSIEGKIVQDADRLDAIGAIGIARTFAYGGNKNREMYNPKTKPSLHNSFDEYKTNQSHTINHFYEKLLLLKDKMNTETAKQLAISRHNLMQQFLNDFYTEWNFK